MNEKRTLLVVGLLAVSTNAGAALRDHLVDLLVDALIDLGFLRVGLISGQSASGDRLVDARVRRVLQRGGDVGRLLAMGLGHIGEGLASKLGTQLLGRDADRGCRRVQPATEAAPLAEAARPAATTRTALRDDLIDQLVDA